MSFSNVTVGVRDPLFTSAVGQEAGGLWHRIAGVIGRSSRSHWYARGQLDERRVMA